MTDIPCSQPDNIHILSQLLGAAAAIMGGFFAVIFRLRLEKKDEISHIKISLTDELNEICTIISKLSETFSTSHVVYNAYLTELSKSNESFNLHKQKFYLIKDEKLRKSISEFYKKLNKNISESINVVGKLGDQPSTEHNQIVTNFTTIASEGQALKEQLNKYKYNVLWIF